MGQSASPSDSIPDFFRAKVTQIRHKINKIREVYRMSQMYEQLSFKFKDLRIITIDFSGHIWPKQVKFYYSKIYHEKTIDIEQRNYGDGRQ